MPTAKEYQAMLAGGCPWCGEDLEIKRGRYGEFIACAGWCGYTKSIPGRSELPTIKAKVKCPYKKCDGSGLIPFKKNGQIVPYAWSHCDCHPIYGLEPEPERYHIPEPEDYDFPMSSTFRAYSFEYCEREDPGKGPAVIEKEVGPFLLPEPEWAKPQWDYIQQLRAMVNYLNNKVTELQVKRKPRGQY